MTNMTPNNTTKYIVLLGDGMADLPLEALDGKTVLEAAHTPNLDALSKKSLLGLAKTVPENLPAGSDVANLSVFGFNPLVYYTGRSPLEAVSMGIQMSDEDVALRCNLVTLTGEDKFEDKRMADYSAGEITTEEAALLMKAVAQSLNGDGISFHPGISYRHLAIWNNGPLDMSLTPPHDISGKRISDYLPAGEGGQRLLELMRRSPAILENHPINQKRIEKGLRPATAIWLWGQGKRPAVPSFKAKYGLEGSVISAVDLIKGIGLAAGMRSINVEGATGNIHTNFKGKARAALEELKSGRDFVYIHIEAPDECGHQGLLEEKVRSVEIIDRDILGFLLKELPQIGPFRILIMPDHPTPLSIKTHSRDPVPFMLFDSRNELLDSQAVYSEAYAKARNYYVEDASLLMDYLLEKKKG